MFSKTVTDKDGNQRVVVSDENDDNFQATADAVANQSKVVHPDIDVPVKKGHDLLDPSTDTGLADGSGAHNSPRDAVRDDGTIEGNPDVPFVVGKPAEQNVDQFKLVKNGDLKPLTDEDVQKAEDATPAAPDSVSPLGEDVTDGKSSNSADDSAKA